MFNPDPFPEMITSLPEADIPVPGLEAYVSQSETQQIIFMRFGEDAEIPEHSHEEQWAVVLDGEIEITIGGETKVLRRGDTYFIPKGVVHSARVRKGYSDVTLFNQADSYRIKE